MERQVVNIKINICFFYLCKKAKQDLAMIELGSRYRIKLDNQEEGGYFLLNPF